MIHLRDDIEERKQLFSPKTVGNIYQYEAYVFCLKLTVQCKFIILCNERISTREVKGL